MRLNILPVAAAVLAWSAQARTQSVHWYANPQIGYVWTDTNRQAENTSWYGLIFGWDVDPKFPIELSGVSSSHDGSARELDVRGVSLDALRVFRRNALMSPYLTVGAGYLWKDWSDGRLARGPLAQAGAGLMIDVAEGRNRSFALRLRPEAHVRWDFFGERPHRGYLDYAAGIGLQLTFGEHRARPTVRLESHRTVARIGEDQ